jgi:hypothetical protein
MKMPKQLLSMYGGQVCEFCPFNNMRLVIEHGMTKDLKKYPTSTKCAAGYARSEGDKVFVDVGDNKKQNFIKRPQACIDENGA